MLTNAAAKAAGAQTRAYKLTDQGGMHLLVRPTGTKSWQLKYRIAGREKLLTLGQFPAVNVARARILQSEAKELLAQGRDPANGSGGADTFAALAAKWHSHNAPDWSAAHAEDVLGSLERDILPELGARPIAAIDAPELLGLLKRIERRGCIATAGRVRQRIGAIFGFAMAQGMVASDPSAQLGRAMKRGGLSRPHPALTDIGECRALLSACEGDDGRAATIAASRFLALTAVRWAAVRGARWSEIDLDAKIWTVPAERMKLSRAKKGDERFDHIVPLSAAALCVLRGMRGSRNTELPNLGSLIFAGSAVNKGGGTMLSNGALRTLYTRVGYSGRHCPHGWRASFSTILNEELGEHWRSDIDRALGHSGMGKVEAAYNRSQQIDRRRELYDQWGALLGG